MSQPGMGQGTAMTFRIGGTSRQCQVSMLQPCLSVTDRIRAAADGDALGLTLIVLEQNLKVVSLGQGYDKTPGV